MNYAGFLRPVWTWLRRPDLPEELRTAFWGIPAGLPSLDGGQAVRTMRSFRAGVPWSTVLHSWPLLDSHDVARFRTVSGSRDRHLVGIGLQMTTPGVPMVFAGDELGLEGEWGEDARRTMPWSRPETWDTTLLEEYRAADRAAALERRARPRRHPLRARVRERDRLPARDRFRTDSLPGLERRPATRPCGFPSPRSRAASSRPCTARDAAVEGGDVLLPADGPSFNAWRLIDG